MICDDCGATLTPANTEVEREDAFWTGATWDKQQYCKRCKYDRADGGEPSYDGGSYEPSNYREDMINAGRGHLI